MSSKAKADVPRWRRKQQPPGPVVTVKGRRGVEHLARELSATRLQTAPLVTPTPFRFRYHLVPFWWLLGLLSGLAFHAAHVAPASPVPAIVAAVVIVLLTRHISDFARHAALAMAALTVPLLPALAFTGPVPTVPVVLGCWACVAVPWIHHYRWRPQDPPPVPEVTDADRWARLAGKRKWIGALGAPRHPAPGVTQYPIILDGAETNIGEVLAHPRAIAATWNKPMTEAYAEPDPTGVESRGVLTLLKAGTLEKAREWDGRGADKTGCAVIARFADSQDARIRFWVPRDGTRHGLVAGATGSGKSYLLDLIIRVAVASGVIVPIILDPQEGQSLPQWRGHVRYASGVDECMDVLEGVRTGMFGRSRSLGNRAWTDEDGHQVQGMDFFDPYLTGLPIVLILGDEYHMLLKGSGRSDGKRAERAQAINGDIAKMGRKTGVSLWPAVQVPSLEEMGSRVVRSLLIGGNVVCLRTGERADAGMIGLQADPSLLPRYFANGEPTSGLGYVVGPELRQAPARIDMVPRHVRRQIPEVPDLDQMFASAIANSPARASA